MVAFTLLSASFAYAVEAQGNEPPLYRTFREPTPVQSMVYGAGDTSGGMVRPTIPPAVRLHARPACEHPPDDAMLHAFAVIQQATPVQAQGLGVVLRDRAGATHPYLTGEVILWRSGKLATCSAAGQSATLVYGAERILAFLLRSSAGTAEKSSHPMAPRELYERVRRGDLLELGATTNGVLKERPDDIALTFADAWRKGDASLLARLKEDQGSSRTVDLGDWTREPIGSTQLR